MALHYFTDKKYLNVLLDKVLLNNSTSEFYAKMGIAWMIATLFCFHEKNVFDFLKNSPLSYEIKKTSMQKIIDSHLVNHENKEKIKKLRYDLKNK